MDTKRGMLLIDTAKLNILLADKGTTLNGLKAINPVTATKIFKGEPVSVQTLSRLAKALDVSAKELV